MRQLRADEIVQVTDERRVNGEITFFRPVYAGHRAGDFDVWTRGSTFWREDNGWTPVYTPPTAADATARGYVEIWNKSATIPAIALWNSLPCHAVWWRRVEAPPRTLTLLGYKVTRSGDDLTVGCAHVSKVAQEQARKMLTEVVVRDGEGKDHTLRAETFSVGGKTVLRSELEAVL